MSLAGATLVEPGDTQAKPGREQDIHKDCGGSKMAATCQVPSHQFPLPLSTPREPSTPTGRIRGAGKRAHSDLSPETPSLIAFSQEVSTKLLQALVSDHGGPSSRLSIPGGTEGTDLAHSDPLFLEAVNRHILWQHFDEQRE